MGSQSFLLEKFTDLQLWYQQAIADSPIKHLFFNSPQIDLAV